MKCGAARNAAPRHYRPWALVNTSGYVKVDQAETDVARCFRENSAGAAVLAAECQRRQVRLLTFSSDLVSDGGKLAPHVEADAVAPLNIYGKSKAEAERRVLDAAPAALVVRSSAFFGPWDDCNFLARALAALERGQPFAAAADLTVSPTYVPDLLHACLDLLIDEESGIWHVTHGAPVTWAELRAASRAGVDSATLEPRSGRGEQGAAPQRR
ncbi:MULTISPECIES: SDR family oxidoreductase [unclassified Janthinobacterium]|uniref:SDR family oxidoreductase n=1 Tax=unclassified Janthinobacterium TaxID=2610881 RepID=UPI000344A8E4|nr:MULTISPECIES: sugar nucleotide-binding protein [unclassified Janthinobacterium]MEC5163762.1 dTDP-4-dehydrorhamnose reductase [Janthinobacterium sp. CG_S6]